MTTPTPPHAQPTTAPGRGNSEYDLLVWDTLLKPKAELIDEILDGALSEVDVFIELTRANSRVTLKDCQRLHAARRAWLREQEAQARAGADPKRE